MADTVNYLIELRSRLLRSFLVIIIIFAILCFFAKNLYETLALPLLKLLPHGHTLIATAITSPFIAPFKLAFVVAIFIAIPYLLYQLWAFVAPGLYQKERRWLWLLPISTLLFYAGAVFAYFIIFPWMFKFSLHMIPANVALMPDMNQYLDFALQLFFVFGLAFEIPVLTFLLVTNNIISYDTLKQKRPYIIVAAFIIGMLLTPPDVISQILLAIPLYLLFEVGLFFAKFMKK